LTPCKRENKRKSDFLTSTPFLLEVGTKISKRLHIETIVSSSRTNNIEEYI
jgi:hypothetical protein